MRVSKQMDRRQMVDAAGGRIPCDLRIVNCRLANVLTGEVYPAAIDVHGDQIVNVHIEPEELLTEAREVFDAGGAYAIPGFIDTHVHVESTMMTPSRFAAAVLPWGTTTVVTDPHEIANVLGRTGVAAMLEDGRKMPLRHYVLAPSCVPANPEMEAGGAVLSPAEIEELLEETDVLGLGEVMDYMGVCQNASRMSRELSCALEKDKFLQGHAPKLTGDLLAAYLAAGLQSDHECRSGEECLLKLRLGMHVNLKSSSLSDHLAQALAGIKDMPWKDNVSLCTDDVHAQTILTEGHLNRVVKKTIENGVDPLLAVRFATYNAAREYGFTDLGAIAPGYMADFQLVRELDGGMPEYVFAGGKLVADHGRCLVDIPEEVTGFPEGSTMHLPPVTEQTFMMSCEEETEEVSLLTIQYKENGNPFNGGKREHYAVKNGRVQVFEDPDVCMMAVINRHGKGLIQKVPVRGTGLQKGAYASTVSHDSHNLMVFYRSESDALAAVRAVEEIKGGFAMVCDGSAAALLPLPVGGIMSELPVGELAEKIRIFERDSSQFFSREGNLLRFATCSLAVLPGFVLTDKGIVDGRENKIVS